MRQLPPRAETAVGTLVLRLAQDRADRNRSPPGEVLRRHALLAGELKLTETAGSTTTRNDETCLVQTKDLARRTRLLDLSW